MMYSVDRRGVAVQPQSAAQSWKLRQQQQEQEAAKLHQAAQMFEAQFVKMLMGEMRNTLSNDSITSGGFGEEMFTSSLDEARADLIVQGRSLGISAMLENQLRGNHYTRPAQFRMPSQPVPDNAGDTLKTHVNVQAGLHAAAASAGAGRTVEEADQPKVKLTGEQEEKRETKLKHEQVREVNPTPVMASYHDMKNIEREPLAESAGDSMIWPVDAEISSKFGMRFHPILKTNRFHSGMDIKAPSGTPVQAAAEGQVIFAGERGQLGKAVIVEHSDGRQTVYGHCSRLLVRAGESVAQGDIIAKVGRTGRTTGPHLHFEVRDDAGKATDPMLSLSPQAAPESMLLAGGQNRELS